MKTVKQRRPLMDYDPNLVLCGRMARQRVRLTFGMWWCRTTIETEVLGNCRGFDVIDSAVLKITESINGVLELADDSQLLVCEFCQSDYSNEETWLKDMLIEAEIISIDREEQ